VTAALSWASGNRMLAGAIVPVILLNDVWKTRWRRGVHDARVFAQPESPQRRIHPRPRRVPTAWTR
jgi:hypothetical protein